MADPEGRPVLTGLAALVAVAVVVGLVLGGAALATTRVLGLGGASSTSSSTADSGASMYLPEPSPTQPENDPAITLAPVEETSADSRQKDRGERKKAKRPLISLSSSQTEVGSMERIDLTGVYPRGEGAILQVERFIDGVWAEFSVTASVSNGTFATYVQTGRIGVNKFRMRDTETGRRSNVVSVRVR